MADFKLTKGSRVEVSSDDVGFKDAWYLATVVDIIEPSQTKKGSNNKSKNQKKSGYLVKYDSLFEEDNLSEPLTEVVEAPFVRPLPPRHPRRNNDNNDVVVAEEAAEEEDGGGVDFALYDVVDAYHLDGWWTGVLTKVINNGENRKFSVSFQSPPEEFEFERSNLRLHLDWIDCQWRVRSKKTPEQALAYKNDTQTPSKGALMNSTKKKIRSRKKPKTNSRNKEIMDSVEKKNSSAKRFQPSRGRKGNTEDMESLRGSSESQVINQDSLLTEQEMIITETGEAEDGNSQQKRKRGRPPKTPVKTPNGLIQDNEEARERDSSAIDEMPNEFDEQPLSIWYQGLHSQMVSKTLRLSHFTPLNHHDESSNILNPETHQNHENHQELPFTKSSPIWATIESLQLYKNPQQNPHFSPLKKLKEDYREGLAIGHMVTFANVVNKTSRLQLTDPNNTIESSLDTLVDLENHGFDVGAVRARLNELLARKVDLGQLVEESKVVKSELMKVNLEKSAMEDEINELVGKMKELQEKLTQAVTMKNVKYEEIVILQSKLRVIYDRITDGKVDFEKIVGTPL